MKALVAKKAQESQQYLTFLLEDQGHGLEIFKIREIRGYAPTTPIPNVPPHVRGVMNLRGAILPVVDLRMKFHLPPSKTPCATHQTVAPPSIHDSSVESSNRGNGSLWR